MKTNEGMPPPEEIRNAIEAHENAKRNILLMIKGCREQYRAQNCAIKYYKSLLKKCAK